MKFVKPKCIVWGETPYGFDATLKRIERAGRTCYNSMDRITEDSAADFVYDKAKSAHLSILEHSNAVFRTILKPKAPRTLRKEIYNELSSQHVTVSVIDGYVYVAGNYRAFLEVVLRRDTASDDVMYSIDSDSIVDCLQNLSVNVLEILNTFDDFQEIIHAEDVPIKLKRVTFEYITDRAVTHELVRHRRAAFSQRSQRYVKENNLLIIEPEWYETLPDDVKITLNEHFCDVEKLYSHLMDKNNARLKAEQARVILPNATATIIVMTASMNTWRWICYLRDNDAVYPPTRKLIRESKEYMVQQGWL